MLNRSTWYESEKSEEISWEKNRNKKVKIHVKFVLFYWNIIEEKKLIKQTRKVSEKSWKSLQTWIDSEPQKWGRHVDYFTFLQLLCLQPQVGIERDFLNRKRNLVRLYASIWKIFDTSCCRCQKFFCATNESKKMKIVLAKLVELRWTR